MVYKQGIRMETVVEEVIGSYGVMAKKAQVTLDWRKPASSGPEVFADPERIYQVWSNLLSNALKFTPAGGEVVLEVRERAGELECSVRDSGPGIPPEDMSRIFGEFEQVHQTGLFVRGPRGTGLGLAISKKIVEDHGGRIWVESGGARGSRFVFTIPVHRKRKGRAESKPEVLEETR